MMTTRGHSHTSDHAHDARNPGAFDGAQRRAHVHQAHRHPAPLPAASLLEGSAATRLLGVSLVLVALWAGVYWALH